MPKYKISYEIRWHVPLEPNPSLGMVDGEFGGGSIEGSDPSKLRQIIVAADWPDRTVFQVVRTGSSHQREAICYFVNIKAWKPSRQGLPKSVPIELPVSRSVKLLQLSSNFARLLSTATDDRLCSEALARTIWRSVQRALRTGKHP